MMSKASCIPKITILSHLTQELLIKGDSELSKDFDMYNTHF